MILPDAFPSNHLQQGKYIGRTTFSFSAKPAMDWEPMQATQGLQHMWPPGLARSDVIKRAEGTRWQPSLVTNHLNSWNAENRQIMSHAPTWSTSSAEKGWKTKSSHTSGVTVLTSHVGVVESSSFTVIYSTIQRIILMSLMSHYWKPRGFWSKGKLFGNPKILTKYRGFM